MTFGSVVRSMTCSHCLHVKLMALGVAEMPIRIRHQPLKVYSAEAETITCCLSCPQRQTEEEAVSKRQGTFSSMTLSGSIGSM